MRTPHEEALARLKVIQERLTKKGPEALSADAIAALFKEFTEGVMDVVGKAPNPAARGRKMRFGNVGDKAYQEGEMVASLPKDVQHQLDAAIVASVLLKKPVSQTKTWDRLMSSSEELKKAMDTLNSGEGSDWVPTQFSPSLIEEVTVLSGIEQQFSHIPMPTNPYALPLQLARLTAYMVSEQTSNTGQTAGTKSPVTGLTGKLTLSAKGIQAEVLVSKNVEEDSIVAIMPFIRMEIVKALVRGIEEATINGDTTGTHQDSDVTASDDRRKLWMGLRKLALANGYGLDMKANGLGFDVESVLKIRGKLGKYGVNPGDLVWLTGLQEYFKLLSLKDAGGHPIVMTLDKFGAEATAKTGVLGKLFGSDVLVSEFSRNDLNASGVYDGVTKTQGSIICAHKPGFVYGDRRDVTLQVLNELYAEYQQDALLTTMRQDFQPVRPIATNAAVAIGYDIDVA